MGPGEPSSHKVHSTSSDSSYLCSARFSRKAYSILKNEFELLIACSCNNGLQASALEQSWKTTFAVLGFSKRLMTSSAA